MLVMKQEIMIYCYFSLLKTDGNDGLFLWDIKAATLEIKNF